LKAVLAPHNLRFGLVKEGVFISTEDGVTARQLGSGSRSIAMGRR